MELSELGRVLHEQHFRILVSICGLENRVTGPEAERPFDATNPEDRAQLQRLVSEIDEIIDHNAFEEVILFPLLADDSNEMAIHLTHEHVEIGPKALDLRTLAAGFLASGCDQDAWQAFKEHAIELVRLMMQHLQQEEASLVQQLGGMLDPETDLRLARERAAGRSGASVAATECCDRQDALPEPAGGTALNGDRDSSRVAPRRICAYDLAQRMTARRRSTALPRSGPVLR
ncbi:MAG: hemerythrin domain-containing protein [Defluviicoccus sp.]|jgi:hemerythrin-like domain-containing protein|nr:hemerythrin domain-containing protein [Defluviicoccus sp.]MDG4608274.1 hemerythrin domain-containing protein [Defluviicoccus sp.]